MELDVNDTIAAIASPPGAGWRGIVRVSGPGALNCFRACFSTAAGQAWWTSRRARVVAGSVALPELGPLPCDLFVWPTCRSFTRQPTVEAHCLGSPPLLEALLETVCAHGARLARPGEFTLRAFLAGRLDLTQAEAVLGVIDAVSERELRTALEQLAGGLKQPLAALRERLLDLLAQLEAGLDFADEDLTFITPAELVAELTAARAAAHSLLDRLETRGRAGREPRVVLYGAPNVGKSSLLNALAEAPVAIVSSAPGATRDYVARRLRLEEGPGGAWHVELIDTAGVDPDDNASGDNATGDAAPRDDAERAIRAEAQRVTREQRAQADLLALCLPGDRRPTPWEQAELGRGAAARLVILTRGDLPQAWPGPAGALRVSAVTGAGLPALRAAMRRALAAARGGEAAVVEGTATRCRDGLRQARDSLARAEHAARAGWGDEIVAAELRLALDDLAQIVGAVVVDDVLDRVFSRFCIGK